MEDFFICPLCGNTDIEKLGVRNGTIYCRACLAFNGAKAPEVVHKPLHLVLDLGYDLTKEQERISKQIKENYLQNKDSLVYAVCGAGKTELIYEVMNYALSKGRQIGFTVPRKEVVIEIANRLKETFPKAKIISVFGEQTSVLTGNIIVLTTHQLYRYPSYFDLLVFDEIDAFPYLGDFVLEAMFKRSIRGNYVLLSATPSSGLIKEFKAKNTLLTLFSRFHNHAIPVPKVYIGYNAFNFFILLFHIKKFIKLNKPFLVFVPTIKQSEQIYLLIKKLFPRGNLVHSKIVNNSIIIDDFKKGNYLYLVTTSVLERGVTIRGLQVIIYNADSNIYNASSLVQIAGRVGRKKEEPDGEVIFIASKENSAIKEAIVDINEKNATL